MNLTRLHALAWWGMNLNYSLQIVQLESTKRGGIKLLFRKVFKTDVKALNWLTLSFFYKFRVRKP